MTHIFNWASLEYSSELGHIYNNNNNNYFYNYYDNDIKAFEMIVLITYMNLCRGTCMNMYSVHGDRRVPTGRVWYLYNSLSLSLLLSSVSQHRMLEVIKTILHSYWVYYTRKVGR